jgi:predicted N-acetyltransferase YhbS
MTVEVRGARADEMPEVLDMVPRVMGATREYFAAAYRNDPWARPEHSRIVRVDGRIVSHIRLYDRWQRVGPVPIHVGCVGDVCTLPEHRKRGYCRALLEDALRYWDENDYDLSMIVSGVGVYEACGWVPLPESRFELPAENCHEASRRRAYEIRRFVRGEDLTAVAAVYSACNAERSLATVRTSSYWERHFAWIAGEIEEAFLVAAQAGQIVAYLRCERGGPHLLLSECCSLPGYDRAAVELLEAALTFAAKRGLEGVQGHFPADHPALAAARRRPEFASSETSVLLFRLVNLRRLLERVRSLLGGRARESGVEGTLNLIVGDQVAELRVGPGWAEIEAPESDAEEESLARQHSQDMAASPREEGRSAPQQDVVAIPPAVFFPMLFGAPVPERVPLHLSPTTQSLLAGLFPAGAPVYWRTDVV